MTNVFFLVQIKHNSTTDAWDKGVVVKADLDTDNLSAAKQSYHAYIGAYAYEHDANIDYVQAEIKDVYGMRIMAETWIKPEPEPEPEPEPNLESEGA